MISILSDPSSGYFTFVLVNLTTFKEGCDESCILRHGDHEFITHDTYIAYARAQMLKEDQAKRMNESGEIAMREPLKPAILRKIREGTAITSSLAQGIKHVLKCQKIIE